MIDRSDSPATTQTNTSYLNSIPSRLASWLYGKLVSIAETVKRIFSRGNMGQSESLPETRPLAERTSSEVKAERTFLHTPDPQVTTLSQEQELLNSANRPLPELNGGEVLCLSKEVEQILNGMTIIFEKLKGVKLGEVNKGECRAKEIKKLSSKKPFDEVVFFNLQGMLNVGFSMVVDPESMTVDEKINFLLDFNNKNMAVQNEFVQMFDTFINDISRVKLPSVQKLVSRLTKKYPDSCIEQASEHDIKVLQIKVAEIQVLLKEGFKKAVKEQIAVDADLSLRFSDISKKLQNLIQTVQI